MPYFFETCLYPVTKSKSARLLHFQASEAGDAVLENKNHFGVLYLRWESDHATPGIQALHNYSTTGEP